MSPPPRRDPTAYHYHAYDYEGAEAWKPGPAQLDRNKYQFYSMVKDLKGLVETGTDSKVPNIALIEIPQTSGKLNTIGLAFGKSDGPTVVITGGIHSNEWMAHEMAYLLAEYLIMHYNVKPAGPYQEAIHDLINSRNIRIFPMVNPDGNYFTVFGGGAADGPARRWRKNRRALPTSGAGWVKELTTSGEPNEPFEDVQELEEPEKLSDWVISATYNVPYYNPEKKIPPGEPAYEQRWLVNDQTGVDLNRNWVTRASGYDCLRPTDEEPEAYDWNPIGGSYFGPKRGGEAETANIQSYLGETTGYAVAIDYHTSGRFIVYPSEVYNRGEVTPEYVVLGKMLEQLIVDQSGEHYKLGTSVGTVGYDATGATDDHMAFRHGAYAFTIELDPLGSGMLLPETGIMACFETNIRAALAAIAWPNPAGIPREEELRQRTFGAILNKYQIWKVYGLGNQLPA
jgi:hypothetical protein